MDDGFSTSSVDPTTLAASDGVRAMLRAATRDQHAAVDAAFGSFGLDSPEGYRRFLRVHARIVPIAESHLAPGALLDGWIGRTAALLADLTALSIEIPEAIEFDLPPGDGARWGAVYVLEGSRLGGALIRNGLPDDWPKAFLTAQHPPGGWQRVVDALERADRGVDWRRDAIVGARAMFDAYGVAGRQERAAA
jgi:heme oxygenase